MLSTSRSSSASGEMLMDIVCSRKACSLLFSAVPSPSSATPPSARSFQLSRTTLGRRVCSSTLCALTNSRSSWDLYASMSDIASSMPLQSSDTTSGAPLEAHRTWPANIWLLPARTWMWSRWKFKDLRDCLTLSCTADTRFRDSSNSWLAASSCSCTVELQGTGACSEMTITGAGVCPLQHMQDNVDASKSTTACGRLGGIN
mmetsp:Transcript_45293/g.105745  ORF Transcript_45293/g.105745 Transcript_45293/m.105745 type:complete len:202 (-) Transcript_45293:199-804(-)